MSHFVARWLKISLVVIVGCGFLSMMIYALMNRDEIRSSQIEPPLIMAPSEPLKRRPDQPGGMQIPNRDKLVFDLLDSSNTTLGATGINRGGPAEVSVTADVAGANPTIVSDSVAAVEAVGMQVEDTAPIKIEAVAPVKVVVTPTAVVPVVAKPLEVKVTEAKVVPPVKVEEKKPVEKKVEAKLVEKPAAGGKWGVQLAAVNSIADGNAMTAKASKDFAVLKALSPKVSAAPGGKKYRVQFVGLKDRDAAAAVCAKLAGKQACFPVNVQ